MKKLQHFFSSRKSWVLPYLIFSVIFVIIPLLLIVVYAFTDDMGHLTLANFSKFFAHSESVNTFVYSIGIAILTTLGCILLGYPVAWILNNSKNLSYSRTLIMLFILPMWVNILVRTLATVALFDFCRLPLGEGALIFGMIYNFIPLSMPGVVSGIMMVFMPTISTFAIAELLTMNNIKLFGTTIQENINNSLWNYGAALSLIMLFLIAATSLFTPENKDESERGGGVW